MYKSSIAQTIFFSNLPRDTTIPFNIAISLILIKIIFKKKTFFSVVFYLQNNVSKFKRTFVTSFLNSLNRSLDFFFFFFFVSFKFSKNFYPYKQLYKLIVLTLLEFFQNYSNYHTKKLPLSNAKLAFIELRQPRAKNINFKLCN